MIKTIKNYTLLTDSGIIYFDDNEDELYYSWNRYRKVTFDYNEVIVLELVKQGADERYLLEIEKENHVLNLHREMLGNQRIHALNHRITLFKVEELEE